MKRKLIIREIYLAFYIGRCCADEEGCRRSLTIQFRERQRRKGYTMNRRLFLKLTAVASSAIFLNLTGFAKIGSIPLEVQSSGLLYKGSAGGEIFCSSDSGNTWQKHSRFASGTRIMGMKTDHSERVFVQVGYAGHSFKLKLTEDGRNWMSV